MNKFLIPTTLAGTIIIAGILALLPIQQATTVHTTISADITGQDRLYHYMIGPSTGSTTFVITPFTTGKTMSGTIAATVTDDPGNGADVSLVCNPIGNLNAANSLDVLNEKVEINFNNCTTLRVDYEAPGNAMGVFVTVLITEWQEV